MTSDRSNDSSFDALWDFDLDEREERIPAALDPRGRAAVTADEDDVPEEERETLLPPVPPGEYVETMMQLGELDDPSDPSAAGKPAPGRAPGAPILPRAREPSLTNLAVGRLDTSTTPPRGMRAPAPPTGEAARRLGRVLAPESELMLPTGAPSREPGIADSALITPDRPPPTSPGPAALAARRAAAPSPGPRPQEHRPSMSSAGLRAPGPPRNALPVPRAPSVPPPPPGEDDPLAAFDALDALDSPPPAWRAGAPKRAPTPAQPSSGEPPPSSRPDRTTATGLRLGRTGPAPEVEVEGDRITPVAFDRHDDAPSSVPEHLREAQRRFDAKNYGGALVLAESVLVSDPEDPIARQLAAACREKLAEKYLASLGGKGGVPRVAMAPDEMRDLSLDHRAGFLLSFIDGSMSIDEVLDVSCMPALDALRMMFELRQQGAIEIDEPPPRPGRK